MKGMNMLWNDSGKPPNFANLACILTNASPIALGFTLSYTHISYPYLNPITTINKALLICVRM